MQATGAEKKQEEPVSTCGELSKRRWVSSPSILTALTVVQIGLRPRAHDDGGNGDVVMARCCSGGGLREQA